MRSFLLRKFPATRNQRTYARQPTPSTSEVRLGEHAGARAFVARTGSSSCGASQTSPVQHLRRPLERRRLALPAVATELLLANLLWNRGGQSLGFFVSEPVLGRTGFFPFRASRDFRSGYRAEHEPSRDSKRGESSRAEPTFPKSEKSRAKQLDIFNRAEPTFSKSEKKPSRAEPTFSKSEKSGGRAEPRTGAESSQQRAAVSLAAPVASKRIMRSGRPAKLSTK